MNKSSLFLALALSLAAPLAYAQQDHQSHHPDATAPETSVVMPSPMLQRLDRMETLVDQLAETDDPGKRRQLMQEHRQAMHEARSMMGAMQSGMGVQGDMPDRAGSMGMMSGGMGMMGGGMGMMPMMQRMETMQAGMEQIMSTEDPAKRLELMKEHRQQMQDAMVMMRGMQQGGGMGMMGAGMMGQQVHAGMVEAFRQMDKRLDLMQRMLERLMEKQD